MKTLNVTMEAGAYMNKDNKGRFIHLGTGEEFHREITTYLNNLEVGQFGWLETNHKGLSLHFKTDEDGAYFTNASGTSSDIAWMTKLYGSKVTTKLTRYMNIRN